MRRREFITLLGGAAAAWPVVARAQQNSLRRIGFLAPQPQNAPEQRDRITALKLGLAQLGWTESRNIRIDVRGTEGDASRLQSVAAELVLLAPEVIVVDALSTLAAVYQATQIIPIVFVNTVDPVAARLVSSMARPDSNVTGFTSVEPATSGKWLELLKEIAPSLSTTLVIFSSATPAAALRIPPIENATRSYNVRLAKADVSNDAGIERAIDDLSHVPHGGIIVLPSPITQARRGTIISRAASYRIPAVYPDRLYVVSGGLMSYGTNVVDQCRQAASYVDRILKGAKPRELPIQQPTKFELTINLMTAKALALDVPSNLSPAPMR